MKTTVFVDCLCEIFRSFLEAFRSAFIPVIHAFHIQPMSGSTCRLRIVLTYASLDRLRLMALATSSCKGEKECEDRAHNFLPTGACHYGRRLAVL